MVTDISKRWTRLYASLSLVCHCLPSLLPSPSFRYPHVHHHRFTGRRWGHAAEEDWRQCNHPEGNNRLLGPEAAAEERAAPSGMLPDACNASVVAWFPTGFPLVSLRFPSPTTVLGSAVVSGFRVVSTWFPCGFRMVLRADRLANVVSRWFRGGFQVVSGLSLSHRVSPSGRLTTSARAKTPPPHPPPRLTKKMTMTKKRNPTTKMPKGRYKPPSARLLYVFPVYTTVP